MLSLKLDLDMESSSDANERCMRHFHHRSRLGEIRNMRLIKRRHRLVLLFRLCFVPLLFRSFLVSLYKRPYGAVPLSSIKGIVCGGLSDQSCSLIGHRVSLSNQ
jgi:hypothetical protein